MDNTADDAAVDAMDSDPPAETHNEGVNTENHNEVAEAEEDNDSAYDPTDEDLSNASSSELQLIFHYYKFKAAAANARRKFAEIYLKKREEYMKLSLDFERELYGQLINSQSKEKFIREHYDHKCSELDALNLTTTQWKARCDALVAENDDLKKSRELSNCEWRTQLDTKEAKLKEFEEEQKKWRAENELLRKQIENNRVDQDDPNREAQPDVDVMDVDAPPAPANEMMSEASEEEGQVEDADDEDYEPQEAFSHKTAGLARIKKEVQNGIKTRRQRRETGAVNEIVPDVAPAVETARERAGPSTATKASRVKKEYPYPQRLCSNPIGAINEDVKLRCKDLKDVRGSSVIPFVVPRVPEFPKRTTVKRKLMPRSGSGSAPIGDPDNAEDEEVRAKVRSAKKGWQASVK